MTGAIKLIRILLLMVIQHGEDDVIYKQCIRGFVCFEIGAWDKLFQTYPRGKLSAGKMCSMK